MIQAVDMQVTMGQVSDLAGAPVGDLDGDQFIVRQDTHSLFADAAEEMTFAMSESVEKKLGSRKKKRGKDGKEAVDRVNRYVDKLADPQAVERFQSLLKHLKQKGYTDKEQLKRQLGEQFRDVSHRYAALAFLRESLAGDDRHAVLFATVEGLRKELLSSHGPAIRAGLNAAREAARFEANGLGEAGELRDFYRSTVLGYEGFHGAWQAITKRFGEANFSKGVAFLLRGTAADLAGRNPSMATAALKQIVDDLYQLQVLGGVYQRLQSLLQKIEERGIQPNTNAEKFLGNLLMLLDEQWPRIDHVTGMLRLVGISGPTHQIYFLQGLLGQLRELPLKVFGDLEQRQKLLDLVQESLDDLIDEEEADGLAD